ncbi:phosphatidylserine decarboxylase family protein [Mesohalobacter halotolerans]|uniref:Phosphatidylserine decarboxylase family protein n=1 Tax=Mesohalobacter halotolerans TaxID=1883405 RepID=A0A4U5TNV7_9FLAO|nr:phosphatidylserine decarboxylase family protein [Mesohalobacter halotolerans]MBS3737878.1 phosphatidylserine decarboxylase family protein [Psychroflexus sp.]TKS55502.1 phosphatidylserine decarboxylase family protein [Mesohalobacter halotolerans]
MFHREGQQILVIALISIIAINLLSVNFIKINVLQYIIFGVTLIIFILIAQFFRNPKRNFDRKSNKAFAPVDGKVVVIEEVFEDEILNAKCIQVSIFMSPLNVHVTRYPLTGEIYYSKYHKGKYLVAWHPKSSTENERTTVALKTEKFGDIAYRQIAGAVARRIVNYAKTGGKAIQCEDSGFIKFGSRVDLFLPLTSTIEVEINQTVKGGLTPIASIN